MATPTFASHTSSTSRCPRSRRVSREVTQNCAPPTAPTRWRSRYVNVGFSSRPNGQGAKWPRAHRSGVRSSRDCSAPRWRRSSGASGAGAGMPLGVEAGDVNHAAREQAELVARDRLADLHGFLVVHAKAYDGVARTSDLTHDVVDRGVRELVEQVLGQRGPVGMTRAA